MCTLMWPKSVHSNKPIWITARTDGCGRVPPRARTTARATTGRLARHAGPVIAEEVIGVCLAALSDPRPPLPLPTVILTGNLLS